MFANIFKYNFLYLNVVSYEVAEHLPNQKHLPSSCSIM